MPKTQDGSGYGAVVEIRSRGPSVAADKGAVAVLIRSVGTDSHRFPHTGMLRYADDAPRIPAAALAAPDAEQLTRILAKGEPVKVHLELTPRFVGERPTGNVIAEIPGRSHPEEIVLLGAHLDSWDLGTGAVDDGAGVGIVVGAAKLLLEHAPRRPARTIRVVLFGAEEVGLVGAKAYAERHADALEKHVVAMESDFGAGRIYSLSAEVGEEAWPRVEALRARHLARLRVIPGQQGRAGGPDLWPMKQLGVPVIGLDQDGRDYFDLHHTADDTLDKIDPDTLWQNVAAYATVAWWASETGPRLRAPAAAMEVSDARPRPAVKVESDQDESAPQK
jgi:Zn-dependent M28 family amino/carboxypeptidase